MANVVLVHGELCDGSSWSEVIPLLFEADHINEVLAVQNPLTGLADDIQNTRAGIAYIAEFTGGARGPTIVVGHSYGGTVVSGAAQDAPDVRALVFVAGVTVDEGEALEDVFERFPSGLLAFTQHDDRGFLTMNTGAFPDLFAQDVALPRAQVMSVVQKWTSPSCFSDELGVPPAWRSLPSTFLVSAEDLVISVDAQRMMAERMGAKTIELSASHASLVSRPREVADAIIEAAADQHTG